MGCCGDSKPKWKREIVPDHKFDNIDLNIFYDPSCCTRTKYIFVFVAVIISFAQCVADLYSAVSLLVIGQTTVTPAIPTEYSKWIFFACIMISFLLIIWDMIKAKRILATRDISSAFTSVIANRYLSMTDYRYYCLFQSINANSKGIENYAFFVYFTLKDWKRLLIAEAPRQVINIVTLEALIPEWLKIRNGSVSFDNEALGDSLMQKILTGTMAFSVLVFSISFILVCAAAILYIPLFCHIRGNLKEYCCHKVDKRISDMLRKQGRRTDRTRGTHPESRPFMDDQTPTSSIYSPSISTDHYEKSSYFQHPGAPSIPGTPSSQQRLLGNYNHDYPPPKHVQDNVRNASNYPHPVAQQLPFQSRAYQYYSKIAATDPLIRKDHEAPSTMCANEKKYQQRKYPRGY